MTYRKDIDGLRAIAVLAVVFFHIHEAALEGGFLGVDVFFVLSGYLITSIIWTQLADGRFTIVNFYNRRIRRIFPALLAVLIVTTLVAVIVLLPADLVGYGRSVLATAGFLANIYFWRDTNYFSAAAEQKPLLHMWSLGVEEQFYIFFPLLLMLCARFWRQRAFLIVTVITVLSFATNMLLLAKGGKSPAFFLLPTRAWELGAGAMIALWPAAKAYRREVAEPLAWLGLGLVAVGLIHPVAWFAHMPVALPAVAGTVLLVLIGRSAETSVSRLLSVRPMVFFGLISYSLYLWHWPVIVFGKYFLIRDFTLMEVALALLVMIGFAVASYRFVEKPFRSSAMPIRRVLTVSAAGLALPVVGALFILQQNGLPSRLNEQATVVNAAAGTNYRCPVREFISFGASRACRLNLQSRDAQDANVILLGNSHAQMYAPAVKSVLGDRALKGLLVPLNGCLPTSTLNINAGCVGAAQRNLVEVLKLTDATVAVIGMDWAHDELFDRDGQRVDNADNAALIGAVDQLVDALIESGKRVVLIGPIATPGWDLASVMSRELAYSREATRPLSVPLETFTARHGGAIAHFEQRPDVALVRADTVQCGAKSCDFLVDGRSLFADSNHIADAELVRYRPLIDRALQTALER
ncbi:MAG: acyltransferase family protein [Gammaproteobacteria bacterium]